MSVIWRYILKKKQRGRGNGKQIAMVVIVIFLIAAIVGALLWLSDLGSNWDVRTWGDKFTQQDQVTKPGNSGSNKPIIPVIPEPALYDEVKVGDEIKAIYIDTSYVITDEDIARFKTEGKIHEQDYETYYYLIYEKHRAYGSPFGLCYCEVTKSMIDTQLGGEELSSEDISDDFAIHALTFGYEGGGGFIWAEKIGYISDDLLNSLFGGPIPFGWSATEYVCSPRSINVQEVRCADILRNFVDVNSEAEYEQQNQ